jgi:hypothetical protein
VILVVITDREHFNLGYSLLLKIGAGVPSAARIVAAVDHNARAVVAGEQGARAVLDIENL